MMHHITIQDNNVLSDTDKVNTILKLVLILPNLTETQGQKLYYLPYLKRG